MEQARLPFGYQPRPPKRSHNQMQRQDRSAPTVGQSPPAYRRHEQHDPLDSDLEFDDDYEETDNEEEPWGNYSLAEEENPAEQYQQHEMEQNVAPRPPPRFPGDGFDYRRPVPSAMNDIAAAVDPARRERPEAAMDSNNDSDVIDLTADDDLTDIDENAGRRQESNSARQSQEPRRARAARPRWQRLPTGMDIIIDLDNGHEEWRISTPPVPEPGSPEIEVISSRELPQPQHGQGQGDEVEFLGMQPLSLEQIQRRHDRERDRIIGVLEQFPMHRGQYPHLRAQIERFNQRMRTPAQPLPPPRGPPRGGRPTIRFGFAAPLLDFDMVGFDMGLGGGRPREPPPPTYSAPDKVPDGFTRDPKEDDVLVCPNCDYELCTGADEVKKQVWIVKACGHVYCGECTTNRAVRRTQKGKERTAKTAPFKECVVEGCGKRVSGTKAMIQVFL